MSCQCGDSAVGTVTEKSARQRKDQLAQAKNTKYILARKSSMENVQTVR